MSNTDHAALTDEICDAIDALTAATVAARRAFLAEGQPSYRSALRACDAAELSIWTAGGSHPHVGAAYRDARAIIAEI